MKINCGEEHYENWYALAIAVICDKSCGDSLKDMNLEYT